ncbi:MAG: dipeptide ABC transporter ATP-binding protein [Candidatus Latescibacteria bacterium]|nr:dipeptide ABC transporter ATP-binding protein [Candidatus Latescibacterota bacterium]
MKKNAPPTLAVEQLSVHYRIRGGNVEAVRDISFAIAAGESFGLVGESGCGKSTVAWAILQFLGPNGYVDQGRLRFAGEDLLQRSQAELNRLRGNKIAMVYQDPMQALNPALLIGDQLGETLQVHQGLSRQQARQRCAEVLDRVHMPDPLQAMRRYPHQLSGGQQQRVVIAMALLNDPALLIMDEPTTALDVTVEAAVLDLIEDLRRDLDTALLFISHNLGVVARVCDRVGVMYAGELVEQAAVADLFDHPRHPYTQGLLHCIPRPDSDKSQTALQPIPGQVPPPDQRLSGCRFAPRCAHARPLCAEKPALRAMDASQVRCHRAEELDPADDRPTVPTAAEERPEPQGKSALQIQDLQAHYLQPARRLGEWLRPSRRPRLRAVDGVDLDLPAGCTLGIVGESGCGKSTLVKTLIGLERTNGGQARFLDFDLTQALRHRSPDLMQNLQMVFQNPDSTLNPSHTVGRQLVRVLRRFALAPKGEEQTQVEQLLEAVRLDPSYYNRYPHQLSGGEKQRVGIARAFASHPDLVLCDEPVSALDVSVQAAILNLLLDIQQRRGTTLIFIAHDLNVVRFFSDYIAVMYLGRIVESGPTAVFSRPPYHPYTEALLSATPIPDPSARPRRIRLEGPVPSPLAPPPGCPFHTRCPRRPLMPDGGRLCQEEEPPWRRTGDGHQIRCHLEPDILQNIEQPPLAPD